MPRKTKPRQKQKQKQKQSQTVIVNVGTRKGKSKSKAGGGKAPSRPQFIPYPVPNLSGPSPIVQGPTPIVSSQESLIQLISALAQRGERPKERKEPEKLKEELDIDEKREVGQEQMVIPYGPIVPVEEPLVSAKPAPSSSTDPGQKKTRPPLSDSVKQPMPGGPQPYTYKDLDKLNVRDGTPNLRDIAKGLGVAYSKKDKIDLIQAILRKTYSE